jgi:hypothetical protein
MGPRTREVLDTTKCQIPRPWTSLHLPAPMAPNVVPTVSKIYDLEHHAHKFHIWGRQEDVKTYWGAAGRRKNGPQGHQVHPMILLSF